MQAFTPPLKDTVSFSNLYDRTQIIIFRYIYGIHGGPAEEVEDLTCETFMRAWKGRSRFSGDEHDALCWLFTIARHLVIDAHRRRMTHPGDSLINLDDTNFEYVPISTQATPEDQAEFRQQFSSLWEVMQRLPDDKREILVLRYMLGWRVKQIAEYLHKKENTISVSIKRSLEQLRQQWPRE